MAGKPIGTLFIELDLDPSRYMKGQRTLLKEATQGADRLEKNFKNLRIKSDANYDLMKAHAITAFRKIRESGKATANDIVRAEKAKAKQLKYIHEQQFGVHKSLITKMKENWLATAAVMVVAWKAVSKAVGVVKDVTMAAARFETLGVVMEVVGKNAGYSKGQMDSFAQGLQKTGISMTKSREVLAMMSQAQIDLTKATKLGRIAQDAAVIGNINSSEALKSLVHGIRTANVRVLRTIGIQVSWEQSYKKAAEAMGRTTDSLTLTEKAQIRVNAVMEAGERISGAYEAAMDTAGKKVLSLARHFNNLKVMAGAVFTPAFGEAVDFVTDNIKDLNKYLEENPDKVRASGEALKVWAEGAINTAKGAGMFVLWLIEIEQKADAAAKSLDAWVAARMGVNEAEEKFIAQQAERGKDIEQLRGGADFFGFEAQTEGGLVRLKESTKAWELDGATKARLAEDQLKAEIKIMNAENKRTKAREKSATKMAKDDKKRRDDKTKAEKKAAKDRADAFRDMHRDLKDMSGQAFQEEVRLLEIRRDDYIRLTQDKITAERWFDNEYKKLLIDQGRASDSFVKGVSAGFAQLTRDQITWGEVGFQTVQDFSNAAKSSMSDFINPLKDDFGDINSLWDSMLDSMVGSLTDSVADMTVQWGISAGKKIASELGGAAADYVIEELGDLIFPGTGFKAGAWEIEKDKAAYLHKGEMVLTKDLADIFRSSERGDSTGAPTGAPTGGTERMSQSQKDSLKNVAAGLFGDAVAGYALGFQTDYAKMVPSGIIRFGTAQTKKELGLDSPIGNLSQKTIGALGTLAAIAGVVAPGGALTMAGLGLLANYAGGKLQPTLNEYTEGLYNQRFVGALPTNLSGYGFDGGGFDGGGFSTGPSGAAVGSEAGPGGVSASDVGAPFERGSPFVPYTGPATVHKGERILSATDNKSLIDAVGKGGGNTYTFINKGIVTTADVEKWFANMMHGHNRSNTGDNYQVVNLSEAGL